MRGRPGDGENEEGQAPARSIEDVHHLRLMALMEDLVREKDRAGAAEALGVDPRTLVASLERGVPSVRMRVALDHMLISGETSVASRQRERFEALQREAALPEMIAEEVRVAVETATETLLAEFRQGMEALTRTAASPEPARVGAGATRTERALNRKAMPAPHLRPRGGW